MSDLTAIDADGQIIEKESDIRKYLKEPWNRRSTALRPGDQPWDNHMFDSFQSEQVWGKLSPREQIARWHELMDEHQMETAVCFPTGSGSIVRLQELPFQIAVARACNDHFAAEYNAFSDRVKCVGVLPMRSPQAAAEELERAVRELGIIGFEILPPACRWRSAILFMIRFTRRRKSTVRFSAFTAPGVGRASSAPRA
jgi:hypothetical protein